MDADESLLSDVLGVWLSAASLDAGCWSVEESTRMSDELLSAGALPGPLLPDPSELGLSDEPGVLDSAVADPCAAGSDAPGMGDASPGVMAPSATAGAEEESPPPQPERTAIQTPTPAKTRTCRIAVTRCKNRCLQSGGVRQAGSGARSRPDARRRFQARRRATAGRSITVCNQRL